MLKSLPDTALNRCSYALFIFRSIVRALIVIPFAVATALQSIRDESLPVDDASKLNLFKILPNWPWEWYAILTLIAIIAVLFEASFKIARNSQSELTNYREAFNKTGKYEIGLNDALLLIEKSLAKGNKNMTKENLRQLAGDKFRSIGWSGQPQIIGHEYEFKTKTFSELEIPIPASHWTPNRLDLETVHSEELPQTCSLGTEANETTQYGRIRVNRTAIISMFPQ